MMLTFGFLKASEPQDRIDNLIKRASEIGSSNYAQASLIVDSAIFLSQKNGYKRGEAEGLRIKGLALFYGIRYSEALIHFIESHRKYEELGDSVGMGNANNMIAIVYSYQGLYEKTLEIDKKNLELRRSIGDLDGISGSLNNIAATLTDLGRKAEALDYYREAIMVVKHINRPRSLAQYYNNIANLFLELGNPDSAYH